MKGASTRIGPRLDNHGIDIRGDGIIIENDGVPLHITGEHGEKGNGKRPSNRSAAFIVCPRDRYYYTHLCICRIKKKKEFMCRKNSQRNKGSSVFQSLQISFIVSRCDEILDYDRIDAVNSGYETS